MSVLLLYSHSIDWYARNMAALIYSLLFQMLEPDRRLPAVKNNLN